MNGKRAVTLSLAITLVFSALLLAVRLTPPRETEIRARHASEEAMMTGGNAETAERELLPGEKLNINSADEAELTMLPGIGGALAAAIVEYRQENGDFAAVEDIMNVNGIGEKRFENIRDYITIED